MSLLHRTRDRDDAVHHDHPDGALERDRRFVGSHDERHDRAPVVRERTWTFAPGQLVSLLIGVAFVALGVIAMVRAGLDRPLSSPVVEVLGFSHTAWLGLAEVGAGVLLILAGTGARGRVVSIVIGAAMMVAGVLIGAETSAMPDELAVETDYGWMLVLVGGLVALAAMVLPVWRSRRVRRDGVDVDGDGDHELTGRS